MTRKKRRLLEPKRPIVRKRQWAECLDCGKRTHTSQLYWVDLNGFPRQVPRCDMCHERRVWRAWGAQIEIVQNFAINSTLWLDADNR